jgi:hypothetical protein
VTDALVTDVKKICATLGWRKRRILCVRCSLRPSPGKVGPGRIDPAHT